MEARSTSTTIYTPLLLLLFMGMTPTKVIELNSMQTIKYLLSRTGVKINSLNKNGFTAIDVVEHCPRDLKGMEVRESLREAGALRARDLPSKARTKDIRGNEVSLVVARNDVVGRPVVPANVERPLSCGSIWKKLNIRIWKKHFENHDDWMERKRDTLMFVATVIATMTLQFGLNPPGGVWQDDSKDKDRNGHPLYLAGTSVLAYNSPENYPKLMLYNTLSFVMSLSTILLLISGVPMTHRIFMWIPMLAMCVTISFLVLTYLAAVDFMRSNDDYHAVSKIIWTSFIVWQVIIGCLFLIHITRCVFWVVRKVQKCRKRRHSSSLNASKGNV